MKRIGRPLRTSALRLTVAPTPTPTPTPTTRIVDDADAGCTLSPGWSAYTPGYGGGERIHPTDGTGTATYETTLPYTGDGWTVALTCYRLSFAATNMSWEVRDGGTRIASGTIDQTQVPTGLLLGSTAFTPIGTYRFATTDAAVVLLTPNNGSDAGNIYAIADAVAWTHS